jgi:thiol:disulfide interchange protein DsbD
VLVTRHGAWEIRARPGPAPAGTSGSGTLAAAPDGTAAGPATTPATFAQAVLFAILGGLILNLMPCVFPILAMKAASLAGSAHDVRHARRDGLAFLAGVLTTFLLLAGGLLILRATGEAVGWGFQLQSPPVTAGLALLMLAVALNLSGVFHVGGSLQGQGGVGRQGPHGRDPQHARAATGRSRYGTAHGQRAEPGGQRLAGARGGVQQAAAPGGHVVPDLALEGEGLPALGGEPALGVARDHACR